MAPVGSKLTLQQLVDAMLYKVNRLSSKPSCTNTRYQKQLELMERKLHISLSLVRGVRNLLQPINRLPVELLTLIFYQTQQHLSDFLPMPDLLPSSWNWLSLTHTCRSWRGLIATSPTLWSSLDSGTLPERFLKRSAGTPLTVYLGLRMYDVSERVLNSIISETGRFRELHLDADSWDPGSGSSSMIHRLTSPAPGLTSLTLVTEGRDVSNGALPPIFNGEMPNLRKLCLKHLTSWPRDYFQHLTHLCLYDQNESSRPTMEEFLDFLERSPLLQELALVRAGPTRTDSVDATARSPRIVSLPYLRQLDLGDWPSASLVARFLSHLHLPQQSADMYFWGERTLNAIQPDSEAGNLALLLPEDLSKLENMKHIKKWYLARQPRVILDTPFVAVTGGTEARTLYMYGTFDASQLSPAQLLSRFPVSEVEALTVRDSCTHTTAANGLDTPFWRNVFERLPALKALEILAFRSIGFTRTVVGALMPQDTSGPEALLCPRLSSLTIEHDVSLPAYFIRSIAEARTRISPLAARLETLRVLVYELNPQNTKRTNRLASLHPSDSQSSSVDDESSDSEDMDDIRPDNEVRTREEEEYHRHTEDDRKLLEANSDSLGEVRFEYGVPLSVGIVPDTWPTRAFDWTRGLGRREIA